MALKVMRAKKISGADYFIQGQKMPDTVWVNIDSDEFLNWAHDPDIVTKINADDLDISDATETAFANSKAVLYVQSIGGSVLDNDVCDRTGRSNGSLWKWNATTKIWEPKPETFRDIFNFGSDSSNYFKVKSVTYLLVDLYEFKGTNTQTPSFIKLMSTFKPDVGLAEITDITTVADVSGDLDGTYFEFSDDAGTVAFWFDIDDSGTAEPSHGKDRSVEITTVNTDDDANTVASKVQVAMDADSKFSATVVANVVTVTDASRGDRSNANKRTTGFTMNVTTQGVDLFTYDVKILDRDSSLTIVEKIGIEPTTSQVFEVVNLGSLANLSTGPAVWELQVKTLTASAGDEAWISYFDTGN